MSKLPLVAFTAVLGLAFVAGATNSVTAETTTTIPSDNVYCYFNMYHCSYDDMGYWRGCDPKYHEAYISTSVARAICTEYVRG